MLTRWIWVFILAILVKPLVVKLPVGGSSIFAIPDGWAIGFFIGLIILKIVFQTRRFNGFVAVMNIIIIGGFVAFLAAFTNPKYFLVYMLAAGNFLNFLAMLFNGGRMPVESNLVYKLRGDTPSDLPLHKITDENTKLRIFCDQYHIPWLSGKIISMGDILIYFGIVLLTFQVYLT